MKIFRQLRWKLTLSYTIVTVSALLVILLVVAGGVFAQIFIPENVLTPEGLVEIIQRDSAPLWSPILAKSHIDTELIDILLKYSSA
jgi:hypothetical protein